MVENNIIHRALYVTRVLYIMRHIDDLPKIVNLPIVKGKNRVFTIELFVFTSDF